jgi:cytochrome c
MFRSFVRLSACVALCMGVASSALAQGVTRGDAQAQVAAAVNHVKKVGVEAATKDFNAAADWKVKGMNVILNEYKGTVLASSLNERLVGKNTYESKDPSGKEFVKEMVATAQKGDGWVDYQFINPVTKKLEERSMFVRGVPGHDVFVGVAITK